MDIRSWVLAHPKGQRNRAIERLAEAADVTPAAVRHWIAGIRRPKPEKAARLVSDTGGEITLAGIYRHIPVAEAA